MPEFMGQSKLRNKKVLVVAGGWDPYYQATPSTEVVGSDILPPMLFSHIRSK